MRFIALAPNHYLNVEDIRDITFNTNETVIILKMGVEMKVTDQAVTAKLKSFIHLNLQK